MGVLGAQYMYLFGADAINPHPKALGHFGRFGFRARAENVAKIRILWTKRLGKWHFFNEFLRKWAESLFFSEFCGA